MKKYIFLLILVANWSISYSQIEPRLVMPVGHENNKYTNLQINDEGNLMLTNAYKDYNTCIWEAKSGKLLDKKPGIFSLITNDNIFTININYENKLDLYVYNSSDLSLKIKFPINAQFQNNYLPGIIYEQRRREIYTFWNDSILIYNIDNGVKKYGFPIINSEAKNISRQELITHDFKLSPLTSEVFNDEYSRLVFDRTTFNDSTHKIERSHFYVFDRNLNEIKEYEYSKNLNINEATSAIQFGGGNSIFCLRGNYLEKYSDVGLFLGNVELEQFPDDYHLEKLFVEKQANRIIINVTYSELPYYYLIDGVSLKIIGLYPGFYIPLNNSKGIELMLPRSFINDIYPTPIIDFEVYCQYAENLSDFGLLQMVEISSGFSKKIIFSDTIEYEYNNFSKVNIELFSTKVLKNGNVFIPIYNQESSEHALKKFDLFFYKGHLNIHEKVPLYNFNSETSLNFRNFNNISQSSGIQLISDSFQGIKINDVNQSKFNSIKNNCYLSVYDGKVFNDKVSIYNDLIVHAEAYPNDTITKHEINVQIGEISIGMTIIDSNFTIYNTNILLLSSKETFVLSYLNTLIEIDSNLKILKIYRYKEGNVLKYHLSTNPKDVFIVSEKDEKTFLMSKVNWKTGIEYWRTDTLRNNAIIKIIENQDKVFCYYQSGLLEVRNSMNGSLISNKLLDRNKDFSNLKVPFYFVDSVLITFEMGDVCLRDANTLRLYYKIVDLGANRFLFYDSLGRFDSNFNFENLLYFVCGSEVIDLAQVKDSLWVPGLVEKIMNNEPILINDRPAPKLSDLNICELTPLIEPIENGEKGIFRYQITPRNGGLGETEVYINGNLTYTLRPDQLEHNVVNQNQIYYLTISKDSLQPFLVGDKNSTNPLKIKSKVKGASIYGRGVEVDMVKETDAASPSFYGVFVGVNDYGNINKENNELRYKNLDFAKKDAEDLAAAVEMTARNLFKDSCHIYKLTGIGTDSTAPTKANLQKVLAEIGQKAKSSDVLFIFFAGHGDILQVKGEKEIRFILHRADKKNITSTSFGVDELKQWCDPKVIKAQKRVFVFDACHSGELINQTMAFNGRGDDEGLRIRQLDRLKDKNGMMILAAAADNEFAYEDETLNQGVLTYHLLEVIKSQEKDSMLTVRYWFDETIEIVKEYSRINGNQQEPSSFGDGRFEIGNIDQNVRQSIEITCPKTRIGLSVFTDPTGEAKLIYPNLKSKINQHFETISSRGSLVYSKNMDKAYRVEGSYRLEKKKIYVRYEIYLGTEQKGSAIVLDPLKGLSEDELVKEITESIQREIEIIDQRNQKCKLKS